MSVAVLKFGGTSVATEEQRAIARRRIEDARDGGFAAVAVVSAMGRSPEQYATDSLLALLTSPATTPNGDRWLAAGEFIAAAVFADELCAHGIEAVAMTSAQAGIVTDG